MTVQAESEAPPTAPGIAIDALSALARAAAQAAGRPSLDDALQDVAAAAHLGTGSEVAVIRLHDAAGGRLEAVAVAGPAPLAAELHGDAIPADGLTGKRVELLADAPAGIARTAERVGASQVLVVPIHDGGTLEVYAGAPFTVADELVAELAGGLAALVLRAFAGDAGTASGREALELAGEALSAALDRREPAAEIVRLAASALGASIGLLWQRGPDGSLELVGLHGLVPGSELGDAPAVAASAVEDGGAVRAVSSARLPSGTGVSTTLPLGEPPIGFLQLLFPSGAEPGRNELERLTTFGIRAAHALRSGEQTRELELELARSRSLLAVVGQATAELSLAHTLETAVEQITELLTVERVAVYLRDGDRLVSASDRGLAGPHARVAERLLELGIGPTRRFRPLVDVPDAATDTRLADVRDAVREAGIAAAVGAPLVVHDEVIGLLAVYPSRTAGPGESGIALLAALAAQLAVAVQNAQLHERTAELSSQREAALASERDAARRLGALYEISRSFAQSLSLEATLEALARTVVDVLDVDAAVIRMPDERREQLEPRALHVKDPAMDASVRAILYRAAPFGASPIQRLFRERTPFRLRRRAGLGESADLLTPFLERGWTGATVPVATPAEVIASLGIISFRPGSPITSETVDAAVAIAGQAALAIDNARLYQQQKEFADTMQRSLLPRSRPSVAGLEVGEVYESSARVDVGGDVYDFVELDDGRLAVVLGDVTGHGVEATADMAMAKFVFRSLAREHPEPADFLAAANDVIVDEIAVGKFITMTYLAIDGARGEVAASGAGHPPARVVLPDGTVEGLETRGLALGIEEGQEYEERRVELPSGSTIVVYTDGVIEARRNSELYGIERLDELLRNHRDLAPHALARTIARDARSFAGGELSDDLAVVVIRRT
ncbi:MAG TPA: SpoIIE family protein phosphatase [Gaiellaceae bacterium]|nr:SpoIIE family protein phosphatase [Gaiellaceae bacterium]